MKIEAAESLIANGQPVEALKGLASAFAKDGRNEQILDSLCNALIASLEHPDELAKWDRAAKLACYKHVVLQLECNARPLVLAHAGAARITGGNADVADKLVREIWPAINDLLNSDHDTTDGFKNLVVLLTTLRRSIGEYLSQDEISKLHLKWFKAFDADDLGLPYSVIFNPAHFEQNRNDLINAFLNAKGELTESAPYSPVYMLFYAWLFGDFFEVEKNCDASQLLSLLEASEETEEAKSARALYLKIAVPGDELKNVDLPPNFRELAKHLATTRRALGCEQHDRSSYQYLQKQSYKVRSVIASKIGGFFPYLHRARRPKVAFCLSGQLRGYETAFASWQKALTKGIESKFFVHSWKAIGRSDAQPFRYTLPFQGTQFSEAYRALALERGYEEMRASYPTLFEHLSLGATASESDLQELYQTNAVVLDDENTPQFLAFSNQEKMHYKINAAHALATQDDEFDLVVRIRPDLPVRMRGFDWRDLVSVCRENPVLFAEKPYGMHYANLFMGDQFAIGSPLTMGVYAKTWENYPKLVAANLRNCPTEFTGHASLAYSCWIHSIAVQRAPIRFGKLAEARPLETKLIITALEADSRNDIADQALLTAAKSDLR